MRRSVSLYRRMEAALETIALGPLAHARYTMGVAEMHPGDVLLLYSDGITEDAADNGEEYGCERPEEEPA